jgi:gliding motility-associated-like protein
VNGLTIGQNNVFQWAVTNGTCSDSTTITIRSDDNVTSAAGPDSVICLDVNNPNTTLTLMATPPTLGTGLWTIFSGTGTINNPTLPNAILTPSFGSNILVWTVMNGKCADSDTALVTYKDDGSCFNELELPTGFSPNGDQYNPAYVIHGIEKYPANSFKVFNRWGNEVFTSTDINTSWDGKSKQESECSEGVYYYILKLNEYKKTGYVILKR